MIIMSAIVIAHAGLMARAQERKALALARKNSLEIARINTEFSCTKAKHGIRFCQESVEQQLLLDFQVIAHVCWDVMNTAPLSVLAGKGKDGGGYGYGKGKGSKGDASVETISPARALFSTHSRYLVLAAVRDA
eukprot:2519269-Amphidinium_carterae.1